METTFCIIGKAIDDTKYMLIGHDPLSVDEAHRTAGALTGHTDVQVVRFDFVQRVLSSLNGVHHTDDVLERAEKEIENILRQTVRTIRAGDKKVEIFVGHESYEVQITIEE